MPQGKRRVANSGKQKKEKMQEKRAAKAIHVLHSNDAEMPRQQNSGRPPKLSHNQGSVTMSSNKKFALNFSREIIDFETKKDIYRPIPIKSEEDLMLTSTSFYPSYLDFPKRPKWNSAMSKEQLDMLEANYIHEFIEKHSENKDIGIFEFNMETWRQLWRVIEKSDMLLVIVDARFAIAQFPPYLYSYIVNTLKKGMIVIINKCDLMPINCVNNIREYFRNTFPKLFVVPFYSGKTNANWLSSTEKTLELIDIIQKTTKIRVNFDEWIHKVKNKEKYSTEKQAAQDEDIPDAEPVLTLGTIGHPNVGKSSFINTIMDKKVVSVSKTPGHTKHFQTIYLTKTIMLCDCPGLVFPCVTSFPLQVIMGSYPVAQVRNPMAIIGYICQYVDVQKILKLKIAPESEGEEEWSSYLVSEAYAVLRNYRLRQSGKPDTYRAANDLLRQIVIGNNKVTFYLQAPTQSENCGYDTKRLLDKTPSEEHLSDDEQRELEDDSRSTDDESEMGAISNKFASLCN